MISKLLHHPISHVVTILVLGFLAYANSFGVPFVLDDPESISRNESIRNLGNFLPGGSGYDFLYRRWVGYFTFALNYRFGGLDVTGYHIVNLAVHLCTALLLYLLLRLTFRTPHLVTSRLAPSAATIALLASLFFVVHPIQTQAVTYTVQRLTSLCTLFYLLALVLYVTARLTPSPLREINRTGSPAISQWRIPLLLTGSVGSAVLAMHTKEIAFTLPLAALLYEICFFRGAWRKRALLLLPLLLTLAIIPVIILADDELTTTNGLPQTGTDIPRLHYLLTQFRVIITYLRLLILPIAQNLDYDYPIYTTFFTAPVFLSFFLLAAIGSLTSCLFVWSRLTPNPAQQKNDPAVRIIAFGIAWFFLTIAIESSLIPLADVIFEHRLYLPSIGLSAAVAVAIGFVAQKTASHYSGSLPILACGLVIIVLTIGTWQRNQIWQSEVTIWQDVVQKSPGKARPWYNLGTYLIEVGRAREAIAALTRALKIDPQHADAWHNLGRAYIAIGRDVEAIPALREAVRLRPEMENAVVNLSVALLHTGKSREAMIHLEEIRRLFPDWPEVRLNLGLAYVGVGNLPAARNELAALYRIAPHLITSLAVPIKQAAANAPPK